jgi:hypothetical protein
LRFWQEQPAVNLVVRLAAIGLIGLATIGCSQQDGHGIAESSESPGSIVTDGTEADDRDRIAEPGQGQPKGELEAEVFPLIEIEFDDELSNSIVEIMHPLLYPQARTDIGLANDEKGVQCQRLSREYFDEFQRRLNEDGIEFNPFSSPEGAAATAELNDAANKIVKLGREMMTKFMPKVEELLQPEQIRRLRQIAWQRRGPEAVRVPEIRDALELTVAQRAEIVEVLKEYTRACLRWLNANDDSGDPQDSSAQLRESRKNKDDRILKVLTDAQRAKFTELLGKPFDTAKSP